jgi:hypothetical protein
MQPVEITIDDTEKPVAEKKIVEFREEAIPLIEWIADTKKFEVAQEAKVIIK